MDLPFVLDLFQTIHFLSLSLSGSCHQPYQSLTFDGTSLIDNLVISSFSSKTLTPGLVTHTSWYDLEFFYSES